MNDAIGEFFLSHGWKLTLIALSGILFLGILKALNVFKKVDKDKQKYIYAAISAGFSIAAAAIYLAVVGGFEWQSFGLLSVGILGVNQAAYAIYETYGIRALVRKIGNLLLNAINSKQKNVSCETIADTTKEIQEQTPDTEKRSFAAPIDDLAVNENNYKEGDNQ